MEGRNEKRSLTDTDKGDVTDIIGHWGKWQFILTLGIAYSNIPAAWYNLGLIFLAPNIDHWCAKSQYGIFSNMTTEEWKNFSIPIEIKNNEQVYSQCTMYNTTSLTDNRTIVPCSSWEYDHSFYRSTIVEKWNLVCERTWMISFANSLYYFGFLVAMFVSGQLSDRFGRKPILYLCVLWTFVFGMISTFSQNFWLFAACRFLISLGRSSTYIIIYVLLMEVVGKEYRTTVGVVSKFGWAIGNLTLAGLAYLFRNWFYMDLVSALAFAIVLPLWWITPESPRWLLSRGKIDEAEKIINQSMKLNKLKIQNVRQRIENLAKQINEENMGKDANKITYLDIIKQSYLRNLSLILYVVWLGIVMSYYGLTFSADDIGIDIFIFILLSGIMEVPAALIYYYLQPRLGRPYTQAISMLLAGLASLFALAVPQDVPAALVTLAVFCKFCLAVGFASIYLFTSELYPTVVRNVGLGSCSMVGRIGAIVAPFMKQAAIDIHWSFPLAIIGSLAIIGGLLALFLPETKDANLPDSLNQGERMQIVPLRKLFHRRFKSFERESSQK